MDKLVLIGGGGHCKSCIDVIELENKFEIETILDVREKVGQLVLGRRIIGTDTLIQSFVDDGFYFLITLGQIKSADLRVKLYNDLKSKGAKIATVISPLSHVSKYAKIGEGTIVMHEAIVNADAKIGNNCIINTKSLVEHDAVIENHCHIATAAVVNGEAIIGEKSFVGSNATVVNGAKLEANSFTKAGSLAKWKMV